MRVTMPIQEEPDKFDVGDIVVFDDGATYLCVFRDERYELVSMTGYVKRIRQFVSLGMLVESIKKAEYKVFSMDKYRLDVVAK